MLYILRHNCSILKQLGFYISHQIFWHLARIQAIRLYFKYLYIHIFTTTHVMIHSDFVVCLLIWFICSYSRYMKPSGTWSRLQLIPSRSRQFAKETHCDLVFIHYDNLRLTYGFILRRSCTLPRLNRCYNCRSSRHLHVDYHHSLRF